MEGSRSRVYTLGSSCENPNFPFSFEPLRKSISKFFAHILIAAIMETGCDSRQCPVSMRLGVKSYTPRRELVVEQGTDLVEHRTCCREHVPRAPPPSPIKFPPLTCAEPNEACPSTSCALLLVDRKIEEHQERLSPMQLSKAPGLHSPALLSERVSGVKLECPEESRHRMTPLRQVSTASDDDDMTVTSSSYPSSRSSGTNTLLNDLPSDREVDCHSAATGVHCQRKTATSLQSTTQPSSPKSPTFNLFSLRSSRYAITGATSRFRSPRQSNDALEPRPTVTGRQISSPTSIGSSIPDMAALPLEYKQSKTKSWPGPCSQLPGPDTVSMPQATMKSKLHKCDFACASAREHKAGCAGMLSCGKGLSRSERRCSFNKCGISLQILEEHTRGDQTMDEQQAAAMEEEHSHFSDYSTNDEDDGERIPSNVRLVKSLGRMHGRSKTRLSWGNLFSKS